MKRLLVLSYDLPPTASAESVLLSKRLAGLDGWEIDAICGNHETHTCAIDHSLDQYVAENIKTITRVNPPHWIRLLPRGRVPTSKFKILGALPDERVYTNSSVLDLVASIDVRKYDAILSWSNWISMHLAAAQVKKDHPSIRWVTHFSDPWVDNPYKSFGLVSRFLNRRMESKVFQRSDAIIFTSQETIDLVMKNYPANIQAKAFCIPHGFDEKLYPTPGKRQSEKIIIRHLGSFYGPRRPHVFFDALQRLPKETQKKIQVEFFGSMQNMHEIKEIVRGPLQDFVSIHSSVNYLASLRMMTESDILFLIDAPAKCSVFFPSKLVDYMGARKPILGVVPEGASKRIINEIGAYATPVDDPEKIADKLLELIDRVEQKKVPSYPDLSRYEVKQIGKSLDRVLSAP